MYFPAYGKKEESDKEYNEYNYRIQFLKEHQIYEIWKAVEVIMNSVCSLYKKKVTASFDTGLYAKGILWTRILSKNSNFRKMIPFVDSDIEICKLQLLFVIDFEEKKIKESALFIELSPKATKDDLIFTNQIMNEVKAKFPGLNPKYEKVKQFYLFQI